jgi:adenosylcobinamide-phosphate synthase
VGTPVPHAANYRVLSGATPNFAGAEIVRATVETVAESTVDGILAPMFFAALGGTPGLWAYKAINTLDSMVGHREEPYTRFGWAAARLDDVANFVPARLGLILLAWEPGSPEESPAVVGVSAGATAANIRVPPGIAEAAMAGALGVRSAA